MTYERYLWHAETWLSQSSIQAACVCIQIAQGAPQGLLVDTLIVHLDLSVLQIGVEFWEYIRAATTKPTKLLNLRNGWAFAFWKGFQVAIVDVKTEVSVFLWDVHDGECSFRYRCLCDACFLHFVYRFVFLFPLPCAGQKQR